MRTSKKNRNTAKEQKEQAGENGKKQIKKKDFAKNKDENKVPNAKLKKRPKF